MSKHKLKPEHEAFLSERIYDQGEWNSPTARLDIMERETRKAIVNPRSLIWRYKNGRRRLGQGSG